MSTKKKLKNPVAAFNSALTSRMNAWATDLAVDGPTVEGMEDTLWDLNSDMIRFPATFR
jgi:hypothetical protein